MHRLAGRDRFGDQRLLQAVQLVELALQHGDARGALCATGSGSFAMRSTSPMTRLSIRSGNNAATSDRGSQVCSEMYHDPDDDWDPRALNRVILAF